MSKVLAKFNVSEIAKYGNSGGGKVTLNAVMGNSEENKKFWEFTPNGRIEIWIDNPKAMEQFDFGEYYVTFEKAEV